MNEIIINYSAFTRLKQLVTLAAGGDQFSAAQALTMLEALTKEQHEPQRTSRRR